MLRDDASGVLCVRRGAVARVESMGSFCTELNNLFLWLCLCEDPEAEAEANNTALLQAQQQAAKKKEVRTHTAVAFNGLSQQ